jgi:hypothetical protein
MGGVKEGEEFDPNAPAEGKKQRLPLVPFLKRKNWAPTANHSLAHIEPPGQRDKRAQARVAH